MRRSRSFSRRGGLGRTNPSSSCRCAGSARLYSRGVPPLPVRSDAAAAGKPVRGALSVAPTYNDDFKGWPVAPQHRTHAVYGTFLNPTTKWPSDMPGLRAGGHKAIDILQNDASGRHPVFAIEGGTVHEATLAGYSTRSTNSFAAESSASATSATRTLSRPSSSERGSRRGRRSARRAWVFGTCISRSGRRRAGRASCSTRFGPAGSSPP